MPEDNNNSAQIIQASSAPPPPPPPPAEPQKLSTQEASSPINPGPTIDTPTTPAPVQKPPKRLPILLILVIVFVLLLSAGLFALIYAKDIPFIPKSATNALKIAYSQIPFLPKTPEQIILRSIGSNSVLDEYIADFSTRSSIGSGTGINFLTLDLQAKGPLSFKDKSNPKFSLSLAGGVNWSGSLYSVSGQILKPSTDTIYFKLDELSDTLIDQASSSQYSPIFKINKDQIKTNLQKDVYPLWVSYSTKGLDTSASLLQENSTQQDSILETIKKNAQDFLLSQEIINEVQIKNSPDGNIHLSYEPQDIKKAVSKFIDIYIPNLPPTESKEFQKMLSENIKSFKLDAWFSKDTGVVEKINLTADISLKEFLKSYLGLDLSQSRIYDPSGSSQGSPENIVGLLSSVTTPTLSVSSVLTFSKPTSQVSIDTPPSSVSVSQFNEALNDARTSDEARENSQKLSTIDSDLKALNNSLLNYFVENSSYPSTLSSLAPKYIDPSYLKNYKYKLTSSGYVIYTENIIPQYSSAPVPFYGITSQFPYARSLNLSDFK